MDPDAAPKNYEYQIITKNGEYKDFLMTSTLFPGTQNSLVSMMDISAWKKAEEALRKSEERLRELLKNSFDIIVVHDKNGIFRYVSSSVERILGYKETDLIGKKCFDFIHPDEKKQAIDAFQEVVDSKSKGIPTEFRFLHHNGSWINLEALGNNCLDNPVINGIIISARDITDRKNMETQLLHSQKMEAIGTLAGGIAHDFNNILGAIIGYTEITLHGCRDTAIRQRLEQVLIACDRAKDLVNQILAFSHQRDQERMPVDVGVITKEALKLLRSSIPSTISIVTNISSSPHTVFADPTQIHQILMNLCSNASHAMRKKGGVLKIGLAKVDYDSAAILPNMNLKPGTYALLTVSDTGHGIDPAIIDRIFDPFFTTKKMGEGTGLGLSVVYGIAESHGGTITVYSELGKGTIFKVYLPVMEKIVPVKSIIEEQIPAGSERILLVDDEEVLVAIGRDMLQTLGYGVVAKTNSAEALDAFITNPSGYDLVISDMTMPNMTGVELSREIRRVRMDIPIIICTGFSELINEDEARRLGIQRLLIKPIFLKNLAVVLREILDKKVNNAPVFNRGPT
jgi:PAS domain S-box-containing protein